MAGEINVACAAYGFKPVCEFCRRGLKTHCGRRTVLGIVAHDGAFAEYLTLPLENLHRVPTSVSDEKAVFIEPLAAACEILEQIPMRKFTEAAVLGDGKLALLIALVLRAQGTSVTARQRKKRAVVMARLRGDEQGCAGSSQTSGGSQGASRSCLSPRPHSGARSTVRLFHAGWSGL